MSVTVMDEESCKFMTLVNPGQSFKHILLGAAFMLSFWQPVSDASAHTQPARVEQVSSQSGDPAKIYALYDLKHRTASHETADALVRVPNDLDVKKAITVVIYNHGFGTNVQSIYTDSHLGEQMGQAASNSILILPEWQAQADSRNASQGRLRAPACFAVCSKKFCH